MTVTITLPVTAYTPGPKFAPYNTTAGLGSDAIPITLGNDTDIIIVPPNTPFEVDDMAEALRLVIRHHGRIVNAPKGA
jgi:hypothetical protein